MPQFQFRLKALLATREAARNETRTSLADAIREHERLAAEKLDLEGQWRGLQQAMRQRTAPGPVEVGPLLAANRYERVLKEKISRLSEREQVLLAEVGLRRQSLIEADREVHMLEKLRERQFERFQQDQLRAEVKQLDEVATRAYVNSQRLEPA